VKRALSKAKRKLKPIWEPVRKIAVIVAGSLVLLAGLAMVVLPGPAVIVIPLGVSILATEVPFARRAMRVARSWLERQRRRHVPAFKRLWKRVKGLFERRRPRHSRP
jgi:hypothetical protein